MTKYLMLCLGLFALLGCDSSTVDTDKVRTDTFKIKVNLQDRVIYKGQTVSGLAVWKDDWCIIALPEDEYPGCLEHEVRHCLEGNFHEGYKSDEGCY